MPGPSLTVATAWTSKGLHDSLATIATDEQFTDELRFRLIPYFMHCGLVARITPERLQRGFAYGLVCGGGKGRETNGARK